MGDGVLLGLWQALFVYAHGDPIPLVRVLQEDEQARALVARFGEHWLVRAEIAEGSWSESSTRELGEAVLIAKTQCSKAACNAIAAEIMSVGAG